MLLETLPKGVADMASRTMASMKVSCTHFPGDTVNLNPLSSLLFPVFSSQYLGSVPVTCSFFVCHWQRLVETLSKEGLDPVPASKLEKSKFLTAPH